jgi:hypothetical protein
MARVLLTKDLADVIAFHIAAYPTEAPEPPRDWEAPFVAAFAALPLYRGWSETIGIRPNGELVRWSTEGEYEGALSLEDSFWALAALVVGVARYPDLSPLLPARPAGAVDCFCLGHPVFVSRRVICGECAGLGWLTAQGTRPEVATATAEDQGAP